MFSRRLSILFAVIFVSIVTGLQVLQTKADLTRTSINIDSNGVFYNLGAMAGGTVTSSLDIQQSAVADYMNFTNLPSQLALCGAGDLDGTLSEGNILGSFVSHDLDAGCGFDHGSIFYITATLSSDNTHYWGNYQPRNANGSSITEYPGVFETWTDGQSPQRIRYEGDFTNTSANRSGSVLLDIALGTNTVSGSMN